MSAPMLLRGFRTHFGVYQTLLNGWVHDTFTDGSAKSVPIRTFRFVEEAIELAQACDVTRTEVLRIVEYVYGRPKGDVAQEIGGAFTTLTVLCTALKVDAGEAATAEYVRIDTSEMIAKISGKHGQKPDFSDAANTKKSPPAVTARNLAEEGYCITSRKHNMAARIDRQDWREYMAQMHTPWDPRGEGRDWVVGLSAGAADFYRRVYSKDKKILDYTTANLLPKSGSYLAPQEFQPLLPRAREGKLP